MVQQGILNIEKWKEFDPIWSRFKQDIRSTAKKKDEIRSLPALFHICFVCDLISFSVVGEIASVYVCDGSVFQLLLFSDGSMMKPAWMLSQVGFL